MVIIQLDSEQLSCLIQNAVRKVITEASPIGSNPENDEILTIQQAAEFLKLSVATIYGLVSRSAIPVNKKSKRLYFSKKELTAWVKEGRRKTTSEVLQEAQTRQTKRRA